MRYKRWCFAVLALIAGVLVFIAGMNYVVDPFGYFTFQSGDYDDIDFTINDSGHYLRVLKAEHVLHFKDQYDAYIVGGSKTGSYRPEKLAELDGYRYYNMFQLGGSLGEYETTVRFLLENADPKKIIINMGGSEVYRYALSENVDVYQIPAVMTGESQAAEFVSFLLKDVTHSLKQLYQEIKNGRSKPYENPSTGERNLQENYDRIEEIGRERFTRIRVLKLMDTHLRSLFYGKEKTRYYDECLQSMQNIKDMCDAQGVELTVILSPAFIAEMGKHDSPYYWDYIRNLATITDLWDFSGYHDIDLNPYNFYNEGHFYYEVADLVVDVMTGKKSYEGFGAYLTKYNVNEQMEKREADYYRLKEEYDRTGTVTLKGMEDASWIH